MDCFLDDREGRVLCSHHADGEACSTKLLWTRVQVGVIRALAGTTLADLVAFSAPSRAVTPDPPIPTDIKEVVRV